MEQRWSHLMVGATAAWGTALRGRSFRKVENDCLRPFHAAVEKACGTDSLTWARHEDQQ